MGAVVVVDRVDEFTVLTASPRGMVHEVRGGGSGSCGGRSWCRLLVVAGLCGDMGDLKTFISGLVAMGLSRKRERLD